MVQTTTIVAATIGTVATGFLGTTASIIRVLQDRNNLTFL